MKVFVTGATGLVGRQLVKTLLKRGHEVLALVRSPKKAQLLPEGVKVFFGDILLPGTLRPPLREAEAVIHAAALVDFGEFRSDATIRVNYFGTLNVFREAERFGVRKGVFVSSVAAFGPWEPDLPVRDERAIEERPLKFTSPYELSKFAATLLVRRRFRWASILYVGAVWGGDSQIDPWFRLPVFVFSRARAPLVHVEDAAEAIALVLEKGRGEYLVVSELIAHRELGKALGKRLFVPSGLLRALGGTVGSFAEAAGVLTPFNRKSLSIVLADWAVYSDKLKELGWRPKHFIIER